MARISAFKSCVIALAWGSLAQAQASLPPQPAVDPLLPQEVASPETTTQPSFSDSLLGVAGLEPESQPYQQLLDNAIPLPAPGLGPAPVDSVGLLRRGLGLENWLEERNMRLFGWVENGYTGSSGGSGLQATQPRLNRFGNEYLLNEIGLVAMKTLKQDRLSTNLNRFPLWLPDSSSYHGLLSHSQKPRFRV